MNHRTQRSYGPADFEQNFTVKHSGKFVDAGHPGVLRCSRYDEKKNRFELLTWKRVKAAAVEGLPDWLGQSRRENATTRMGEKPMEEP